MVKYLSVSSATCPVGALIAHATVVDVYGVIPIAYIEYNHMHCINYLTKSLLLLYENKRGSQINVTVIITW